jgi:hypothetical protein
MTGSAALEGYAARAVALRGSRSLSPIQHKALSRRDLRPSFCPRRRTAKPVARMSVSEIRGRHSSSQAAPGFHGACHRAGHFGPDPLVPSGLQKKGRRNAGRRVSLTSAPPPSSSPACGGEQRRGRGARPAGHRSAPATRFLGRSLDGCYPPCACPSPASSRRPVIVPAGRCSEAARVRSANPPAGTAPAPSSGLPPEGVPSERDSAL